MHGHKTRNLLLAMLCLAPALSAAQGRMFEMDILTDTFGFDEATPKNVALADLHQGCPHRDCIPSIDEPDFVKADEAIFLKDTDVVLTIVRGDDVRAYPTRILNFHEIVNDVVDGEPIAITYCPLCGSGLAFHREVGGQVTEFGVSGVLHNSDLVMYDRRTETLWDQIEGKGIVGELTDTKLVMLPTSMSRWARWRKAHPDTLVLSMDTGFDEDYSTDPYADYGASDRIVFPVSGTDGRLGPKTVVYGAYVDDTYVAWTHRLLASRRTVTDQVSGRALEVTMREDGSVMVRDDAGVEFVPVRLFWFAWFAFHPDTLVRDLES